MSDQGDGQARPGPSDGTIALAVAAILGVLLFVGLPERYAVNLDRRLSTLRTTPDGAMALYLSLESLGVPVERRWSPLADADPVDPVLAVLDPTRRLTPREVEGVVRTVSRGGELLYVPGREDGLAEALGLGSPMDVPVVDHVSPGGASHRWLEAADTVRGADRALRWKPGGEAGAGQTPLVLAADSGAVLLSAAVGEGRVLVVADADLLTNEGLREGGAAPIVARWASEATAGGEPLVFDEFHHGMAPGGLMSGLSRFLASHPAGRGLLQLAAVGLLGLVAAGRRFGGPRPEASAPRRSPLEHVDALAGTYQEARALGLPRLRLLAGLARHLGRPRPRDEVEAGVLLARLRTAGRVDAGALDDLEASLAREDGLVAVAGAVDRILEARER